MLGSNEAMQREPSLEPPDEPRNVRKPLIPPLIPDQRDWATWHEPDDEVFPKGIDDSMGG